MGALRLPAKHFEMTKPIAVLYATREGLTRRVAGDLRARGLVAAINPNGYSVIVLVASVHQGKHERGRRNRGSWPAGCVRERPASGSARRRTFERWRLFGAFANPLDAFGAGLADKTIVTTLCPGGKERMRRLMRLVFARRIDLTPLFTHVFPLDAIERAYGVFESRKEFVLKVAIHVR
jgi:threonine dehydrogenase-like Zn-dependent dehydrogenase